MTGPVLPPQDRPERLSIITAVLLVAVGNFASAVFAALLVLLIWLR
jgi:hypothetical protein